MDFAKLLEQLRERRAQVGECILSFERLESGETRRGRKPKWMDGAKGAGLRNRAAKRERKPGSSAKGE